MATKKHRIAIRVDNQMNEFIKSKVDSESSSGNYIRRLVREDMMKSPKLSDKYLCE